MGHILNVGGNYNNAARAGLFYLNCNNNPSNNNSNIGGRLAKGTTPEALQPQAAGTACAFWGMCSASVSSTGETPRGPGRPVTPVTVAPACA